MNDKIRINPDDISIIQEREWYSEPFGEIFHKERIQYRCLEMIVKEKLKQGATYVMNWNGEDLDFYTCGDYKLLESSARKYGEIRQFCKWVPKYKRGD